MNFNPKDEIQKKILIYTTSLVLAISFFLLLSRIENVVALISDIFSILLPFFLGFGIAFILNPGIMWLENKIAGTGLPLKKANIRLISCLITFLVFVVLFLLTIWILVPALLESLSVFIDNIPQYSKTLENYLLEYSDRINIDYAQIQSYFSNMNLLSPISSFLQNSISKVFSYSYSLISVMFKFIIGLAAAFYLSMDKERLIRLVKVLIYAVFSKKWATFLINYGKGAKVVFEKYIIGNIIDSSIVGVVCWVVCLIFQVPYAPMIALFVGITNLIPVFGPFLGAVPVIIILLLIKPFYAIFFAVFILILQQVDGNILKPIILGDKLGLSGFWILFAVTIGGSLFGILGMFLGVPVFALIYEGVRNLADYQLEKKNIKISKLD